MVKSIIAITCVTIYLVKFLLVWLSLWVFSSVHSLLFMDIPTGLRVGLAIKYREELVAATGKKIRPENPAFSMTTACSAVDLELRVIRARAGYIPEYLILTGASTPNAEVLQNSTTLWLNTADNSWRCYTKGHWEIIPTPCTNSAYTHPSSPTIRLYYLPSWPNPFWLPPCGFRRMTGEQIPRNRENSWVQFLCESWEASGKKSAYEDDLQAVFRHIHRSKEAIPAFDLLQTSGMFEDGNPPTLDLAINTLHGVSELEIHYGSIFSGDGRHKNLSIDYFRKLFMNPTTCARDMILPDVYAHRINTSSSLSEVDFKLPFHLRDGGTLIPDRSVPGNPIFQEVVYTTRGQVTAAHTDDIIATKIVIHLHGPKLWLKWPCNHHNRKFLREHWLSQKQMLLNGSIMKAIQNLTDMSARFIEEPLTCFCLSPAEIHAVISLGRSVHINLRVVHMDHFRESFRLGSFYDSILSTAVDQLETEEAASPYTWEDLRARELYITQCAQLAEWWIYLRKVGTKESKKQVNEVAVRAKSFNSIWTRLGGNVKESVLSHLSEDCGKAFEKMLQC
jgi:hypothetical protein